MPERGFWAGIGERPWIGLILAVVVVLLDQWTKQIAVTTLSFRELVEVTGWFDWMLTYNTGAAFSFWLMRAAGNVGSSLAWPGGQRIHCRMAASACAGGPRLGDPAGSDFRRWWKLDRSHMARSRGGFYFIALRSLVLARFQPR